MNLFAHKIIIFLFFLSDLKCSRVGQFRIRMCWCPVHCWVRQKISAFDLNHRRSAAQSCSLPAVSHMCRFRQDASAGGWKLEQDYSGGVYTHSVCRACRSQAVSFQSVRSRSKRDWWLYRCVCAKKEPGEHMDKIKPKQGADCPWTMAVCHCISRVQSNIEINDTLNDKKLRIYTTAFCNRKV